MVHRQLLLCLPRSYRSSWKHGYTDSFVIVKFEMLQNTSDFQKVYLFTKIQNNCLHYDKAIRAPCTIKINTFPYFLTVSHHVNIIAAYYFCL